MIDEQGLLVEKPAAFQVGSVALGIEGKPSPFLKVVGFTLPVVGTYTLEGPNGSGKSTFVQLITATLPEQIKSDQLPGIEIGGRVVRVTTPSDAINAGIIAVFQDDELIASMTVFENLLLRHSTTKPADLGQYLYGIIFNLLGWTGDIISMVGNIIGRNMRDEIARFLPSGNVDWRDETRIRKEAERRLASFGPKMAEILDRTPQRLSGGEMAVAKLLAAQLYKNVKILILDEALSGLQRDVWPFLVDQTKRWAQETGATVIAVSHSPDELARWQPLTKFEIRSGRLQIRDRLENAKLHCGVPARNTQFPIFEVPFDQGYRSRDVVYRELWSRVGNRAAYIFLVDPDASPAATNDLVHSVPISTSRAPIRLNVVEGSDFTTNYRSLIEEILKECHDENGVICVIGGGLNLNTGAFVASTVNRGQLATVLVPTTLLAMADVAVGSKTSIDFGLGSNDEVPATVNRKHTVGTYFNPTAVVLDPRYLETLPTEELRIGLVECLKHGILQAPELVEPILALICNSSASVVEAFDIAKRTMELKSETLELDPWEDGYARILLFGHLHAHCLERIAPEPIQHGRAVLLGMTIDACLTGSSEIETMLISVINSSGLRPPPMFFDFDLQVMRQVYESSNKVAFRAGKDFKSLRIPKIGAFAIPAIRDLLQLRSAVGVTDFSEFAYSVVKAQELTVTWARIAAAYATIRSQLQI